MVRYIVLPVLFLLISQVSAIAATWDAEGQGSFTDGRQVCEDQAMTDARSAALAKYLQSLPGGFDAARHGSLITRADEFVKKEKRRSFDKLNADFCRVKGSFRFNERAISKALKENSIAGAKVGVVLRYRVNNRLAEDAGVNPLDAVRALQAELQKYNCQIVNLLWEQDQFSRRMQEEMAALAGNDWPQDSDTDPDMVYTTGLSHAQTIRNALIAMKEEVLRQLDRGNDGFDRLVSGEVTVRDMGPNPDGNGVIAQALISLSMHDIASAKIIVTTRPIPLRAPGPGPEITRNIALSAATESAIRSLAAETDICAK